jgi:phage terminase small subunit
VPELATTISETEGISIHERNQMTTLQHLTPAGLSVEAQAIWERATERRPDLDLVELTLLSDACQAFDLATRLRKELEEAPSMFANHRYKGVPVPHPALRALSSARRQFSDTMHRLGLISIAREQNKNAEAPAA